jgi:hypothetical protein
MASQQLENKPQSKQVLPDLERQDVDNTGAHDVNNKQQLAQNSAQPEAIIIGVPTWAKVVTIVLVIVYVGVCVFLGFVLQLALFFRSMDDDVLDPARPNRCKEPPRRVKTSVSVAGIVLIWAGGVVVGIYCCVLPFKVRRKGGKFTRRHLLLLLPVLAQVASVAILMVIVFSDAVCG